MATLDQLIDSISSTGFPRPDVRLRARYLREHGLIPSGPRGRGAPHMDSTAASRLVLALLSSKPQTLSVSAVNELAALKPCCVKLHAYYQRDCPDWHPPALFPPETNLLSALSGLLDWWRLPDPTLSGAPPWIDSFRGLTISWANGTPVASFEFLLTPASVWGQGPNRLLFIIQEFVEPGATVTSQTGTWFSASIFQDTLTAIASGLGQLQPALPLSDQKAEAADPGPGQPLHQPSPLSSAGKKLARQQSQSSPPLPPSQAERENGGITDPPEDEKWPLSNSPMQAVV